MKKRISVFVMCLLTAMSMLTPIMAHADWDIKSSLDGKYLTFDQPPLTINDRVMVPIRVIFESMGYSVEWDQNSKTATANKSNDTIIVQMDNQNITYSVNGNSGTYYCDAAPQIVSGRILVPVRAISECAGCDVRWDGNDRMVYINTAANHNPSDYNSYLGTWYYTPEYSDRPLVKMNIDSIDNNTMSVSMERTHGKGITYVIDPPTFETANKITASGSFGFVPYGNEFTKANYTFFLGNNSVVCIMEYADTGELIYNMNFVR
ncbi:MAG: copper amine oxidase N-terminal domain-containing protein [Oscillospiraceae bacterium]|nr:copper amine oxidase N-terminal domain-containing protein [Oscillospiraceae bacterium]